MNECCTQKETSEHYPKSYSCPENGQAYASVKRKTLLHHISRPWLKPLAEQGYYFCTDPECDVVYFGQDNTVVHRDELRTVVGQKSDAENAALCYCFGVTKAETLLDKSIKGFIALQTKKNHCAHVKQVILQGDAA